MRPTSMLALALPCALAMLSTGEVLAASTPSWEEVPPMITPRGEHTATVLEDGRVLVLGGKSAMNTYVRGGTFIQDVEIYDPASKAWTHAAPLGTLPRDRVAAVLMPSGELFATDGTFVQAYAPALDSWSPLPPLPTALARPFAVPLPGGRVLVIGDIPLTSYALGGSIYDPASGSWTRIRAPGSVHLGPIVGLELLDDGGVLVVTRGGSCIYVPEADTWMYKAGFVWVHEVGAATARLRGGNVLVVGGSPDPNVPGSVPDGSPLTQTIFSEVYLHGGHHWTVTSLEDPNWSPWCARDPSEGAAMSQLRSGRVIMTGGIQGFGCLVRLGPYEEGWTRQIGFLGSSMTYDPALFSWAGIQPPPSPGRAFHTSTLLADGSTLIAGGYVQGDDPSSFLVTSIAAAALYHELSSRGATCDVGSDCESGFCADSVCCDAACAGPCDACAAAAGASQDGVCTPLSGAACDDADACLVGGVCEAGTCRGGAPAPDGTPCHDGATCSAASACVGGACVGTASVTCQPVDGCHEAPACDPAVGCSGPAVERADGTRCDVPETEGAWRLARSMPAPLQDPAVARLSDGTVLVVGSTRITIELVPHPIAVRYHPRADRWQTTGPLSSPSLHSPRPYGALVPLPDGTALLVGYEANAERFDPATGTWALAAPMLRRREWHKTTLLPDGRVFVVGGNTDLAAELYDPTSDTWTPAGPRGSVAQAWHTATLLADGRVLMVGRDFSSSSLIAEVYSPATDSWAPVAAPDILGSASAATLLTDGRVLVVQEMFEGTDGGAGVYDPASDTWTVTGRMVALRNRPRAALLSDGRVLVMGSVHSGSEIERTAELYDPATNTWTLAAPLDLLISGHAMAALQDGRVLVAGGSLGFTEYPVANAWLHVPGERAARGVCQDGACVPGGHGEGGAGGEASSGGDGSGGSDGSGGGVVASSTSVATGGGSVGDADGGGDAGGGVVASSTSIATGGGSEGPSDGHGCRMMPASQGAAPWLLVLGALATVRLRRRHALALAREASDGSDGSGPR
ncbi:kelch repeat-containing protein [Sorangium sp. So ce119]|uniref:kelch repeat-containing protein n=1 Tax=Sorangium sp. So ce119 TaxID=3133279 RepID=UPI003F63BCE0